MAQTRAPVVKGMHHQVHVPLLHRVVLAFLGAEPKAPAIFQVTQLWAANGLIDNMLSADAKNVEEWLLHDDTVRSRLLVVFMTLYFNMNIGDDFAPLTAIALGVPASIRNIMSKLVNDLRYHETETVLK